MPEVDDTPRAARLRKLNRMSSLSRLRFGGEARARIIYIERYRWRALFHLTWQLFYGRLDGGGEIDFVVLSYVRENEKMRLKSEHVLHRRLVR